MGIPFRFQNVSVPAFAPQDMTDEVRVPTHEEERAGTEQERSCGDCHACCVHLPISAGEVCSAAKPAGAECPRLCQYGCRIYQQRPESCRSFNCAWLVDPTWPAQWRPEQSGLLCLREEIDGGIYAALVYEIQKDAIARPSTRAILEKLKESCAVIAVVNLQQQRQLLHGRQWSESAAHGVRRPHFLHRIESIGSHSTPPLRDAS